MRVISGTAKGRILVGPKDDRIRPALDKVKQAIFNILGEIEGKMVLDLFAGTGSIGIEALSRGAAHATFVDSSREAVQIIYKNLERCRFISPPNPPLILRGGQGGDTRACVLKMKIPPFAPRHPPPYDLIFVDPPYDQDLVNLTLATIAREKLLAPGGIVVVEHSPREKIDEGAELKIVDQRKYGQTLVSFLK